MTSKQTSFIVMLLNLILVPTIYATNDLLMDPQKYAKIYSHCDPNPNSIIHQNNGLYYVKPSEDGPIIPVICSNGYTMIDFSLDTNLKSIPHYLSSHDYARGTKEYILTQLDDTSTFRQWWLPSDKNTKFRIAKNCASCEQSTDPKLRDNVVYYTDSNLFCYTSYLGQNACSDEMNEFACNVCDIGQFAQVEHMETNDTHSKYWKQCTALQSSADMPSWHEPQMRVNHHLIYRPMMSLTRSSCTCYQPQIKNHQLKEYDIPISELPPVTINGNDVLAGLNIPDIDIYVDEHIKFEDIHICDPIKESCQIVDNSQKCNANIVYLKQSDFENGTYRIRECGQYIFTEDIVCNFNAPSEKEENDPSFSPNKIDGELYWYPTREQSKKDNDYPGIYDFIGSYSLGFFSALTVECDDVIIDFNGFSLSMHRKFYLQQRFFSLVEMASKMFEPLQGPSHWGLDGVYYANNLEIRGPGTLEYTSHHGIHGNLVRNVYIHDLDIMHFDVSGLSCNACSNIRIENVRVGPQNKNIPTLGRYTHSRAFLPRLKHLNDKHGHEVIQFYGRLQTTVSALCQRMVNQMDMIYHNVINGRQYAANDSEWIAAQKIYKNPTGWMDGGSSYGIVINGRGAAVVGIGVRVEEVSNVSMKNVEVFGIYNQAIEKIKFGLEEDGVANGRPGTTRGVLFDTIDWINVVDQIDDRSKSQYIGDVYTDVQFAVARFIDSWYYRNSFYVGPSDYNFVFKGNSQSNEYPFLDILPQRDDYWNDDIIRSCGTDIQLHSSKGAIGMMINGAQESTFDGIYIHDVYNWADLGMEVCGPYERIHITFEDEDIQYGYTGTHAHGLVIDYVSGDYTNVLIEDVESWHGEANGMTIYKNSIVGLKNIEVNNVKAGSKLTEAEVEEIVLPNVVPRACALDAHSETDIDWMENDHVDKNNLIVGSVAGFEVCDVTAFGERDGKKDMMNGMRSSYEYAMLFVVGLLIFVCVRNWMLVSEERRKMKKFGEFTPLLVGENYL